MNILKKLTLLFLIILSPLAGKDDYQVEVQPAAIEEAITLPNLGLLKQKENGFVYLDISNDFIANIVPLLEIEGDLRATSTATRAVGAHISVFHEKEEITPEELGMSFTFFLNEIRSFTLRTRDGVKKLWVLAITSPELEILREKYGLSPQLQGNDFHVTLGKQMPTAPEEWKTINSLSDLNFSNEQTLGLATNGDFTVVEDLNFLERVAKVDAIGQLCLKNNGFVYLNVSNQFIDDITPVLPLNGEFHATSTKVKKMGAHISTIYEDEMIKKGIWNLQEAGEWFTFEVRELRYVDRKTKTGKSRLWLLAADCPGLERLRTNYNLKPKLQGHDFHITLGTEKIELPSAVGENTHSVQFDFVDLKLKASAA
jgi:hypothetical protein